MAQSRATHPLSEANLQQQQDNLNAVEVDDAFVNNLVRDEELLDSDRALFETRGDAAAIAVVKEDSEDLMMIVTNDYRPGQSSIASPLLRLTSISATNDTTPLLARQALVDTKMSPSSLTSVQVRSILAAIAAGEVEVVPIKNPMGLPYTSVNQGPQGNPVRVQKNLQRRKRHTSSLKVEKSDEDRC